MIDLKRDLTYGKGPDDLMDHSVPNLTSLLARRRDRLREFKEVRAPETIIRREERMVSAAEIALKTKVGSRKLPPIPEWLDGWPAGHFDSIPDGALGSSKKDPFILAPKDWDAIGVPYGAWCLCDTCDIPGRSTPAFDFFADGPGEPLTCEACNTLHLRKR